MEKEKQRTVEELEDILKKVKKVLIANDVTRWEAMYICFNIIADAIYQGVLDNFVDEMKRRKKGGKTKCG